jgi:ribosomal protein S2
MSEIINLRQVRKRLARAAREDSAAANRAKHGRTKAERTAAEAEAARLNKTLDGAKLEE